MSEIKYKCPVCGQSERFRAWPYIEYHTCLVDSSGAWVDDYDCVDSEFGEGVTFTCSSCNHEAPRGYFEV